MIDVRDIGNTGGENGSNVGIRGRVGRVVKGGRVECGRIRIGEEVLRDLVLNP